MPADIKDVVFNTAIRTGDANQWNFLLEQFKTTKVDSDRQKYMTALAATVDQETLLKYLNMTIYPEDYGIRVADISFIYESVTGTKNGGDLAMKWLRDNYEEILNSLGEGGGEAGGGGFSRLAATIIGKFKLLLLLILELSIVLEVSPSPLGRGVQLGNSKGNSAAPIE